MSQKTLTGVLLVLGLVLAGAWPARAQQTFNVTVGYVTPLAEWDRVPGDVLVANRSFLLFEVDDFSGPSIGGEWLVPLGHFFEAGAGVSYSRRTVHSVYAAFVDSDGTEVEQDLQLQLVPAAFTLRVLPFGQSSPVQPYVGAGFALINWRYSETGEFIDFGAHREIFSDSFVASGTEPGAVVLGGLRVAGDRASAGGEVRYQKAEANLNSDFAGRKLDLGGWTYNFTVGVRF